MTLHSTCDDLRQAIMASVIGEADQAIGDEVRHHLDMCHACRHFRDALMEEERMLRSAFDTVAAEAEPIRDRLVERLCNHTPSAPESCHSIRWRLLGGYRTMKPFYKLLSAAASIAIVVAVIWGLHSGDGRGIVFADVVAPLRHIERVAFDVTVRTRNPGHSSAKTIHVFMENDWSRVESWEGQKQPFVVYLKHGAECYAMDPAARKFIPSKCDPQEGIGMLAFLASLPDAKVERDMGEQVREGRRVRGFVTKQYDNECPYPMTVWVDVQTRTLVGFTGATAELVDGHPAIEVECKNLRWNEAHDETFFQVPPDYKPYAPPPSPADGETLGIRHLNPGVRLTLYNTSNRDEAVAEGAIEWVALRHTGDEVTLVVRLNPEAYKRVSPSAQWEVNFNDVLRPPMEVEQLVVDRKHELVLLDVTLVADRLQEWLTPVESSHLLAAVPVSQP
jgi:hypothetical protein